MDSLSLFGGNVGRPSCGKCLRPLGTVRWEVRVGVAFLVVCPYCAHSYESKRQLPPDG